LRNKGLLVKYLRINELECAFLWNSIQVFEE